MPVCVRIAYVPPHFLPLSLIPFTLTENIFMTEPGPERPPCLCQKISHLPRAGSAVIILEF